MLLALLVVLLIALLAASYFCERRHLFAPSVLFSTGLLASSLCALIFSDRWELEISPATLVVVAGGTAVFLLGSMGARRLLVRFVWPGLLEPEPDDADDALTVNTFALVCLCVLEVVVLAWQLVTIQGFFPDQSLAEAISSYNHSYTFTTEGLSLGVPLSQLRNICMSSGYLVLYLAAGDVVRRRFVPSRLAATVVSVALVLALSLSTGSRTGAVGYAFAFACMCYCRYVARQGVTRWLNGVTVAILAAAFIVLLASFRFLAIGRDIASSFANYIAIYLGAEIGNLDQFLTQMPEHAVSVPGGMTFFSIYSYLGGKLGISDLVYVLDLPFVTRNGFGMGNVYTTFYAFVYDFGLAGVPILTLLMSGLSEGVFLLSQRVRRGRDIALVAYGMVAYALVMCFFSNKFYEAILAPPFLRILLYLLVGKGLLALCARLYDQRLASRLGRVVSGRHR